MTTIPRGIRNNNPLNIRKGNNWQGERSISTDAQFEQFDSMVMGLRAAMKLVRNYIQGRCSDGKRYDTIRKLVSRWAPPSENVTDKYISFVAESSGIHQDAFLYFDNEDAICSIVRAMAFVECGQWINEDYFHSAYRLL